jgi:uncharacterized protein (DUF305 family)
MRHFNPHLLPLIVAMITATACGEGQKSPVEPAAPAAPTAQINGPIGAAPAPSPSAASFEQKFMTDMIDHHHMAVMMAEVCLEKAVHEELRTMCENIIATQSAEIQLMQTWLRDWYDTTYAPQMKPGMMREMERLAALSPTEFEIAFMEMMIRHHEAAIREGEKCVRKAYHEELISLCHDIIEAQSTEIAQMEEWLCAWYGRCSG